MDVTSNILLQPAFHASHSSRALQHVGMMQSTPDASASRRSCSACSKGNSNIAAESHAATMTIWDLPDLYNRRCWQEQSGSSTAAADRDQSWSNPAGRKRLPHSASADAAQSYRRCASDTLPVSGANYVKPTRCCSL